MSLRHLHNRIVLISYHKILNSPSAIVTLSDNYWSIAEDAQRVTKWRQLLNQLWNSIKKIQYRNSEYEIGSTD